MQFKKSLMPPPRWTSGVGLAQARRFVYHMGIGIRFILQPYCLAQSVSASSFDPFGKLDIQ